MCSGTSMGFCPAQIPKRVEPASARGRGAASTLHEDELTDGLGGHDPDDGVVP